MNLKERGSRGGGRVTDRAGGLACWAGLGVLGRTACDGGEIAQGRPKICKLTKQFDQKSL